MSDGWSVRDKAVLKAAIERAKHRAEDEVLREFRAVSVKRVDDLWLLEQKIRAWRKQIDGPFIVKYATAESDLAEWVRRGWMKLSDLQSLSAERLTRIKKKT